MVFKKDDKGNLVLDKDGNPIALLKDGTEQNSVDIDLEGDDGDTASKIVDEIAKKFNIQKETKGDDKKTLTNEDVMNIIEKTVTKVRTEEKDKLHTQIEKSRKASEGADEKVNSLIQGFKDEIMPEIQNSIKKVSTEVEAMKSNLGTSIKSSNNMQLATLKGELIKQAKGNVIEELITGETSDEMLENFKVAVSMFNKYGTKKVDEKEVKKDKDGNIIDEKKDDKDAKKDEVPDIGIEIPSEFKDTKYEDLPEEVKLEVDKQVAEYYEKNPVEKEKIINAEKGEDKKTEVNNETKTEEKTAYKLGGLNVARAILSGNSGANADPTSVGMDLPHEDFSKNWGDNREEMIKAAEQQAVGQR